MFINNNVSLNLVLFLQMRTRVWESLGMFGHLRVRSLVWEARAFVLVQKRTRNRSTHESGSILISEVTPTSVAYLGFHFGGGGGRG